MTSSTIVGLHSKDGIARFFRDCKVTPTACGLLSFSLSLSLTHTQIYTGYHIKHKNNKTAKERTTQHRGVFGVTAVTVRATGNSTYYESMPVFLPELSGMCIIILSSVAGLAVPYFSTSSHKRHDFRGGGVY